jgi:adenosine kinase
MKKIEKKVLICGSYAFDNIMKFDDKFDNHILPDNLNMLNISFLVPNMRKEFGGCAGNIAYNLNLLKIDAVPMATVGEDFNPYLKWMKKQNINSKYIKIIDNSYTAQAFIATDISNNQIILFHPGAMDFSHTNNINDLNNVDIGIISPDGYQGMLEHAAQFTKANIPFVFDPGQGIPMFTKEELMLFIQQSSYIILNEYESKILQEKTKLDIKTIASKVTALIVTKGDNGSLLYVDGKAIEISPVKANCVKDPTGCGDAYRAGLLYGIINKLDWQTTAQLASILGSIKVESVGPQNHYFDLNMIEDIYLKQYKTTLFK